MIARVDFFIINEGEARQLTGEVNLVKAARAILAMGAKNLIIKRGEYGVLLFSGDSVFAAPAYPLEKVFDPTGAGDTFAGGFMGYLASTGNLRRGASGRRSSSAASWHLSLWRISVWTGSAPCSTARSTPVTRASRR